MEERIYTVYMHTCLENNKKYIGITSMIPASKRWTSTGNGYNGQHFYKAIKKYGWHRFEHEILLCNLTKEEAEMFEIEIIKYYQSNNLKLGYNIDNGGNHQGKMSKETKLKLSMSRKGKKLSQETKDKIREKSKVHGFQKGVSMSQEMKNRLSKIKVGKKFTEEHKIKIGKANKGRKLSGVDLDRVLKNAESRKRPVKNITTGEIFKSATDAGIFYGIQNSNICRNCKGRVKTAGGYEWEYV